MTERRLLDSWKAIAAYLGRSGKTCRHWEKEYGLPIHRLDGSSRAHVFAYTDEVDRWKEHMLREESAASREITVKVSRKKALSEVTLWRVKDLVRRWLRKDPRRSLHEIGDGRLGIEAPASFPPETARAPRRPSLLWLAAGAAAILFAGMIIRRVFIGHPQTVPSPSVVSATIKVEPGLWLDSGISYMYRPSRTAMAISGDGGFIVYSAIEENPGPQAKPQLFLRRINQLEAKPITGTEGGINPFLSPDDRWVGFWADGRLKKVRVEGGVPITLCELSHYLYGTWFFGAHWGRDNRIVFADRYDAGLTTVSAEGGKPEILTRPDPKREEYSHRLPSWLPDGKAVLFTVMRHAWDSHPWIAVLRLDTHEWNDLVADAADARYVSTGHLVFLRQGTLMAVRFDLASLKVSGQPVPLVENVMQGFNISAYDNTGAGQVSISDTGSLVYATGGLVPDTKNSLVWVDQKGIEQPVTALQLPLGFPRLSPDGQRIAYGTGGREHQAWVYDLGRGTNSPLTVEGMAVDTIWTPDGKRVVFAWQKSLVLNLFWQPFDGSAPMERLTTSESNQWPGSWSSDGKSVAIMEFHQDTGWDVTVLDARSGRLTPFLNSSFNEVFPEFSPDGRWIAYISDESKRPEVFIRAFPGPGIKQQVSSEGGLQPLWAKNGKQLFYRWMGQVWVVDVRTDNGFVTTKPRLLFEKSGYHMGMPMRSYDLSLDGQRFLMVKDEQQKPTPVTEMVLVQNWIEELKRLVPTGKK